MSFRSDLETWTANQIAARALSDQAKSIRRLLRGNDGGVVLGPIDSQNQGLPGELREVYPPGRADVLTPTSGTFGFSHNDGTGFLSIDGDAETPSPALLVGNKDWLSLDGSFHLSWDGSNKHRYDMILLPWYIVTLFRLYTGGDYLRYTDGSIVEYPWFIAGAAYNDDEKLIYTVEQPLYQDHIVRVSKLPAYYDDSNRVLVANGSIELIDEIAWGVADTDYATAVSFNGSATKFCFSSWSEVFSGPGYKDLWEGTVTPTSVSCSRTFIHDPDVRAYCFCDYKEDALVYVTIDIDYGTYETGWLVHHGVDIPDIQFRGMINADYTNSVYSWIYALDLRADVEVIVNMYSDSAPDNNCEQRLFYRTPFTQQSEIINQYTGCSKDGPILSWKNAGPGVWTDRDTSECWLATHYHSKSYVVRNNQSMAQPFQEVVLKNAVNSVGYDMIAPRAVNQ